MSAFSRTPTLTPSRSPSPQPPVQPDHFYGAQDTQLPPSPDSDGKTWLDPESDPLAHRGIPVFKPTMAEFQDFEGYVSKIECWGSRSGIVKVIPPKEWTNALPSLLPQLQNVKIQTPIEQHMLGSGGLFRQENMEKRKVMSVREWVELCGKEEFRAPGVQDVGLHARSANSGAKASAKPKARKGRKKEAVKAESAGPVMNDVVIKEEPVDDYHLPAGPSTKHTVASPPNSDRAAPSPIATDDEPKAKAKPKAKGGRRAPQTRETREANLAERAARDGEFLETFAPHKDWLPANTKPSDYTRGFCQKLERQYWRNCGLGKPAWYGADTQGSLYTDATTAWNVGHLPSTLTRLLPSSDQGLPGVNTPYLYFGMWRATFAWHVEDMDLFSINYIHFGAPKFWYAIPQGRAGAMEQTMRGYFPKDTSACPQFLRHKSFLASPTLLAQSSCRPNFLVQQTGEFVITFPRGYHAGFNLGLNCAESVNFALDSWLELGRRAKACECISDSVRIDVDQLLHDRAEEVAESANPPRFNEQMRSPKKDAIKKEVVDDVIPPLKISRKRKSESKDEVPKLKKLKIKASATKAAPSITIKAPAPKLSVTLKLGPRPAELEPFPCCLCVSMDKEGLLRVQDPPIGRKEAVDAATNPKVWMAHDYCASIIPETWVDEIDAPDGSKELVVFGVDGIVKDRWNLKCSSCTKNRPKAHGAPVQCTKGKCPKAFHVSCAKDGGENGTVFNVVREVEKEVVLLRPNPDDMRVDSSSAPNGAAVESQASGSLVLKVIKKLDVQILCTQHNPAVAAQKKASKQDKIKNDLLALPSMARIKIRVSAGVFEVSLIRVIEEAGSVEVLWDRGIKREFKWGSVVFGSTDGPVLQKPSEVAPGPERPLVAATSGRSTPAGTSSSKGVGQTNLGNRYTAASSLPYVPPRAGTYDYWTYSSQQAQYAAAQSAYGYSYNGYYPTPVAGGSQGYNPYSYAQNYTPSQYREAQLNWQQPYQGPQGHAGSSQTQDCYRMGASHQQMTQPPSSTRPPSSTVPGQLSTLNQASASSSSTPDPRLNNLSQQQQVSAVPCIHQGAQPTVAMSTAPPTSAPTVVPTSVTSQEASAYQDLAALSSLQPSQIAEILRNNPQLRDIVWAAVDQSKRNSAGVA